MIALRKLSEVFSNNIKSGEPYGGSWKVMTNFHKPDFLLFLLNVFFRKTKHLQQFFSPFLKIHLFVNRELLCDHFKTCNNYVLLQIMHTNMITCVKHSLWYSLYVPKKIFIWIPCWKKNTFIERHTKLAWNFTKCL